MAYELIETIEVGAGGAASIEFTSIPQDGVDLLLVSSVRSNRASTLEDSQLTLNNVNSGDPYTDIYIRGNGSAAVSNSSDGNWMKYYAVNGNTSTANTFSSNSIYIANYTSSSVKSISYDAVQEDNASTAYQYIMAASANVTAPITSIKIAESQVFLENSVFSLYKIY